MKGLAMNKSIPSQMLFVKYCPPFNKYMMASFSCECTNVRSLIKTMNLYSKDNSLKLPTNCDTWVNNFVLS